MSDPSLSADIAAMNFEDALAELEQIVRRLEAGQVKLDEAIQLLRAGSAAEAALRSTSSTRRNSGSTAS